MLSTRDHLVDLLLAEQWKAQSTQAATVFTLARMKEWPERLKDLAEPRRDSIFGVYDSQGSGQALPLQHTKHGGRGELKLGLYLRRVTD